MNLNMSPLTAILAVLLSAISIIAGIPNEILPLGSPIFGLTALVPLYLAIRRVKSWRGAALMGGCATGLVHLGSSFWLANFKEFAIFTLGASALVNLVMGLLVGLLLRWALTQKEWYRPFLFAAVWTVWEWFKSVGFLAYPWGTLVMTSRDLTYLVQIADLTGTWGIGFLLALVSAALGELLMRPAVPLSLREPFAKTAIFVCFLLVVSCGYGAIRIATLAKPVSNLDVVVVQQDSDSWDDSAARQNILESEQLSIAAIREKNIRPDLVVWSESVLPWPYAENKKHYEKIPKEYPLPQFLADINAPLLSGSPVLVDPETNGYGNSVILLDADGRQMGYHSKIQLVPFAEYMPFTQYAFVREFFDTLVGFSDGWVPGMSVEPMRITDKAGNEIAISTPICFEDAFSGLNAAMRNAGGQVIVNLTNDAWSKTDSAELQHFAIASFRTIELRTSMVRSTNAGYTVVLDQTGKVLADLPLFTPTSALVSVPVYASTRTFYARFGDWFPALLTALLLFLGIRYIVKQRID